MCGIAGFALREEFADTSSLRLMCDQIRHRGPDDAGYYVKGGCALGMRRLSIIDLHTGRQPISNEDGTIWVVFNGEIYNYRELRTLLTSRGHRFRTHSDTEVLVHLYEDEGVAGISRLRGMFAYAIWDQTQRKLLLARDRFGKKPLYYALRKDGLWFGSELKCLRVAGVPLELDRDALRLYFQFNYIPDPASAYAAVRKVPAGGWLTFSQAGEFQQGRYWQLPVPAEQPDADFTEEQAIEAVRETFDESVRLRMIADVPLGAFLSGGIDSSSVVASMARQSDAPVQTFSIGFEESEFNELPAARLVAAALKTDHHELIVRPDAVDLVPRLVHFFDEPFGDSSAIPTFLVSQLAAQHVKVALTGDGGDELFSGYTSLFQVDQVRRYDRWPSFFKSVIRFTADRLPYAAYGKNFLRMVSRERPLERYFDLNYAPFYMRSALLKPDWTLPADNAYLWSTFAESLGPQQADILTQVTYFEATTQLTSDMLVKVDRMSMANSLEVRCPLLDHKLAELAMRIPHQWKRTGKQGKQILLKAIGDRLPPELLKLPKKGFGVPLAHWFRGSLRSFLWDHLTSKTFLERGVVSESFLRHLLKEHDEQRRNNYHWLWMLLVLDLWFRECEQSVPLAAAR
jgi:asparagine synthase (glutamine-hydrolysing)